MALSQEPDEQFLGMNTCKKKTNGLKDKLHDPIVHTIASTTFFLSVFWFSFKFGFELGGGFKGRGWMQGDRKMSGIRMHDVKSTKN